MMKKTCAGLAAALALFVVELQAPQTAEACGVKLIVKTPNPRQAVARSSRPSDILVVGEAPQRLRRDLAAKGHKVETAPDAGSAKRQNYAAVITDEQHANEARAKFGNEVVIVRSANVGNDVRGVETVVARRPVNTDKNRVTVATANRKPIAAGPTEGGAAVRKQTGAGGSEGTVAAAGTGEVKAQPKPTPPPEKAPEPKVAAVTPPPKPVEDPTPPPPKPAKPDKAVTASVKPVEETRPAPEKTVAPSKLREEIYFGLGSANVSRKSAIARAAKWLNANTSGSILIEGHADPTGTPEGNQVLSQSRADAVKDAIVAEGGDASRIEVQAYGDTKLKYGRTDGRNRRVAIQAQP